MRTAFRPHGQTVQLVNKNCALCYFSEFVLEHLESVRGFSISCIRLEVFLKILYLQLNKTHPQRAEGIGKSKVMYFPVSTNKWIAEIWYLSYSRRIVSTLV